MDMATLDLSLQNMQVVQHNNNVTSLLAYLKDFIAIWICIILSIHENLLRFTSNNSIHMNSKHAVCHKPYKVAQNGAFKTVGGAYDLT